MTLTNMTPVGFVEASGWQHQSVFAAWFFIVKLGKGFFLLSLLKVDNVSF